jgi:hypothetical protein
VSLQCSLLARSRIVPWSTAMRILVVASGAGAADHAPRRRRMIVASGSERTTRILPRRVLHKPPDFPGFPRKRPRAALSLSSPALRRRTVPRGSEEQAPRVDARHSRC